MPKKPLPKLALDTTAAIYFLPGARTDANASRRRLIDSLILEMKYEFVIPSPVLAEILAPIPPENRDNVVEEIHHNFCVLDFDSKAAEMAVRIYRTPEQIASKQKETKARVKYDEQIIGTCIRWGIEGLCTFDGKQAKRYNALAGEIEGFNGHADNPQYFIDAQLLTWNDGKQTNEKVGEE